MNVTPPASEQDYTCDAHVCDAHAVLQAWRLRALNITLGVMSLIALPAVLYPLIHAFRQNQWPSWVFAYTLGYCGIVALYCARRLNWQVRGWIFLVLGYFVAINAFARTGLAGSGRLYLLWVPLNALILLGVPAGIATAIISALIFALFTFLPRDVYLLWLSNPTNPLDVPFWIEAGTALYMLEGSALVLLERFHHAQVAALEEAQAARLALSVANQTLEQRVAVRTQELQATNLHLQQEIVERERVEASLLRYTHELEASNAELDAFAHTVAHDLKNPLTTLIGYSQTLESLETEMPETQRREAVQVIARNGRKMTNIINELLLLAGVRKIEQIPQEPLDMGTIVREAASRMETLLLESKAEIRMPNTWPVALGHAAWVEEVWANYLSNAIKYGGRPASGIPPLLDLGYDMQGAQVRFWVRDNGMGLTPEQQQCLFAPFTRLEQTRAQGHGLGLSIVRRIVEKLGGAVGVESAPGAGSRFYFTLPRGAAVTSTRPVAATSRSADAGLPDPADAGLPDPADAGLPDPADAGLPDLADAELPDLADAGLPDPADAGLPDPAQFTPEWRAAFRRAADQADAEQLLVLLSQVRVEVPLTYLEGLIGQYRFDVIQQWLESPSASKSL